MNVETSRGQLQRGAAGGSSRCHNHDAFLALVSWEAAIV